MLNRTVLAAMFLVLQGVLVRWAAGGESPPAPPVLAHFPSQLGGWGAVREDPIGADVARELRADQLLSRSYAQAAGGARASLFVAWFQSQRAGASQPHSPKVCLPAAGWIPAVTGEITLPTEAGEITVNRYIVVNREQRNVVLYWYQAPRRVTTGEWQAKFWSVADALRDRRTDTALVRVVVASQLNGDEAATAAAASFVQSLYPMLRETLPQ